MVDTPAKPDNSNGGYGRRRAAYVAALKREATSFAEREPTDKSEARAAQVKAELDRFGSKPANPRRETA